MKFTKINTLEEMARIGEYDTVEVVVFTNDSGKIPHFHIRDIASRGSQFHCCVRIDKAEYFKHKGKEDKLNSKDRKDLVEFLSSNGTGIFKEFTNWQILVTMWNMNNSDVILDENTKMPDYTQLQ